MDYIYFVLILMVFGLGFYVWRLRKQGYEDRAEAQRAVKEKDEYAQMGRGLVEYQQKLDEKKNLAKDKILKMLVGQGKLSHKQVAEALGLSKNTTIRYLDELESEGKIKQVGKTGRGVFYAQE